MSLLDKKYVLTINLEDSSVSSPKNMAFFNTDKNIANLYVKVQYRDDVIKYISKTDAVNYNIKLTAIKPKTNTIREIEGIITNEFSEDYAIYKFELPSEFTDQVGYVACEFVITNSNETLTINPFSYTINASKVTGLNPEIVLNPDLPILKQLIEDVKSAQQWISNIDDKNVSEVKTYSNKKIEDIKKNIDEQFNTITTEVLPLKVNKNETGWANLNVFDEETRAKILGLSEGETNINAVLGKRNVKQNNVDINVSFGDIEETVKYLTSNYITDRYLVQDDLNAVRGNFSVDVTGNITCIKDTQLFNTVFLNNITSISFNYKSSIYIIVGESNGIGYGFDFGQKKIYEFKNNYTSLGNLVATLDYTGLLTNDKITLQLVNGNLKVLKNDSDWFTVSKEIVNCNKIGFLYTGADNTIFSANTMVLAKTTGKLAGISQIQENTSNIQDIKTKLNMTSQGIKKWGVIGDSISILNSVSNGVDYGKNYTLLVQEKLKIDTIVNKAVAGTRVAYVERSGSYAQFAMCRRYKELPLDCDLITVMGGTNDFSGNNLIGTPLGTISDKVETTFYGALRILIEGLLDRYGSEKILFITPLKNGREINKTTGEPYRNDEGHTQQDYRNAIVEVCELYGVSCYRLDLNSKINQYTFSKYTTDEIHPNGVGNEIIEPLLSNQILLL